MYPFQDDLVPRPLAGLRSSALLRVAALAAEAAGHRSAAAAGPQWLGQAVSEPAWAAVLQVASIDRLID